MPHSLDIPNSPLSEAGKTSIQIGFYNHLIAENPFIDPLLFLFVENYPEIAKSLSNLNIQDHESILKNIEISEVNVENFCLKLFEIRAQNSIADLIYFLREKLIESEQQFSSIDWGTIMTHLCNNPVLNTQIRKKLWHLQTGKKNEYMRL